LSAPQILRINQSCFVVFMKDILNLLGNNLNIRGKKQMEIIFVEVRQSTLNLWLLIGHLPYTSCSGYCSCAQIICDPKDCLPISYRYINIRAYLQIRYLREPKKKIFCWWTELRIRIRTQGVAGSGLGSRCTICIPTLKKVKISFSLVGDPNKHWIIFYRVDDSRFICWFLIQIR